MTNEELERAIMEEDWRAIWIAALHDELPSDYAEKILRSAAPEWLKHFIKGR